MAEACDVFIVGVGISLPQIETPISNELFLRVTNVGLSLVQDVS